MNNFDLKKFLIENKLTSNSKSLTSALKEQEEETRWEEVKPKFEELKDYFTGENIKDVTVVTGPSIGKAFDTYAQALENVQEIRPVAERYTLRVTVDQNMYGEKGKFEWDDYRQVTKDLSKFLQPEEAKEIIEKHLSLPETIQTVHIVVSTEASRKTAEKIGRGDYGRLD